MGRVPAHHTTVTRALSTALEHEHGLTIDEFEVLLCRSGTEQLKLIDLAQAHMSPSGLTGLVNRLARRGLVRRSRNEHNARSGYLELADTGTTRFSAAVDGHIRSVQAEFLSRLTATGQHLLTGIWRRFDEIGTDSGTARRTV